MQSHKHKHAQREGEREREREREREKQREGETHTHTPLSYPLRLPPLPGSESQGRDGGEYKEDVEIQNQTTSRERVKLS